MHQPVHGGQRHGRFDKDFIGAISDRPGLLRTAHHGALFLDEIGELGLDEQAMLLKAIEEKRFFPVGADKEVESYFQLMCGTNRDLRSDVVTGRFREDLFARINLWTYELPGLATLAEGGRIALPLVEAEIARLRWLWRHAESGSATSGIGLDGDLHALLRLDRTSALDLFDRLQRSRACTTIHDAMKESQHIEWKETWRDEYLRWISGFANAQGGVLVIGRNNQGEVVGVPNAYKLLEDLPNKIRDVLGLVLPVNLKRSKGKNWIEIVVPPSPFPVSYKGEYHVRSGATKQELKGAALDPFLLCKRGLHWDGVPVAHVKPPRSIAPVWPGFAKQRNAASACRHRCWRSRRPFC